MPRVVFPYIGYLLGKHYLVPATKASFLTQDGVRNGPVGIVRHKRNVDKRVVEYRRGGGWIGKYLDDGGLKERVKTS